MPGFTDYLAELRAYLAVEERAEDVKPALDTNVGKGVLDDDGDKAAAAEKSSVPEGSVMRAQVRAGTGTETPPKHAQVVIHYTCRSENGVIFDSTRAEHGGSGYPTRFVLGKGQLVRGLDIGLSHMTKNEVVMFKLAPEVAYKDPLTLLTAPKGTSIDEPLFFELELIDFHPIKVVTRDASVVKRVLKEGEGWETPRAPFEVRLACEGRTLDGRAFFPATQDLRFTIADGKLPPGLEQAVSTMLLGERALVTCCGTAARECMLDSPPARADIVEWEVELLEVIQVRDMTGDGGVIKKRVKVGRTVFPIGCPLEDCTVSVHCVGRVVAKGNNNVDNAMPAFVDTRAEGKPLEFETGSGQVPEAIDMSVRLMTKGEVAVVRSTSQYAYDTFQPRPSSVPEGASVQWELELLDFSEPRMWEGLSASEVAADAAAAREAGNRLFKDGNTKLAFAKYQKTLRKLEKAAGEWSQAEGETIIEPLKTSFLLNIAACQLKQKEYLEAAQSCNKVLELQPGSAKALYRRGQALAALGEFDAARADYEAMAEMDDGAHEVDSRAALAQLAVKVREYEERSKKTFAGMFGNR
eukprot:jgi/Chlat1/3260/Chrsp22S00255